MDSEKKKGSAADRIGPMFWIPRSRVGNYAVNGAKRIRLSLDLSAERRSRLDDSEQRAVRGDSNPADHMLRILSLLNQNQSEAQTQSKCRKSLQDLVPSLIQHQRSTVAALSEAMDVYADSPNMLMEVLRMLHAVFSNNSTASQADTAKQAIECALAALLNFPNHVGIHCLGVDFLRKLKSHLIQGEAKVRATCVIFYSHTKHMNVAFLQQVSLCLLAWLVEDKHCRAAAVRLGGPASILKAMAQHTNDSMVQCNATAIICWMVHGSTQQTNNNNNNPSLRPNRDGQQQQQDTTTEDSRTATQPTLEPWAFPIILHALVTHFHEVSVFGNCVCLLSGIPGLPQELVVLELVRLGMKAHQASAKAQEACLRWIRFRDPHRYAHQLVACLPVVLEAMKAHPVDRNVQAQACEVLVLLLDMPDTRQAILELGAVDSVLSALSNHKGDGHIQHAAIWFLTLLLPFNEESASRRESTAAFGGGFVALETVWRGMGIESTTTSRRSSTTGTAAPLESARTLG